MFNLRSHTHIQPFSCNVCGKIGHKGRGCTIKPADFINVIDMVPLQDKTSSTGSINEVSNIGIGELDIHIELSQSTNEFACSICDY